MHERLFNNSLFSLKQTLTHLCQKCAVEDEILQPFEGIITRNIFFLPEIAGM